MKRLRSGSSARKLRRLDVDLLAGRAINRQFFPLTAAEMGFSVELNQALRIGLLPQIQTDPEYAIDALDAYVSNYLREEIQQEAREAEEAAATEQPVEPTPQAKQEPAGTTQSVPSAQEGGPSPAPASEAPASSGAPPNATPGRVVRLPGRDPILTEGRRSGPSSPRSS